MTPRSNMNTETKSWSVSTSRPTDGREVSCGVGSSGEYSTQRFRKVPGTVSREAFSFVVRGMCSYSALSLVRCSVRPSGARARNDVVENA